MECQDSVLSRSPIGCGAVVLMSEAKGVAMAMGATVAFQEDGSWQNEADHRGAGKIQAGQVAEIKTVAMVLLKEHDNHFGGGGVSVQEAVPKETVVTWSYFLYFLNQSIYLSIYTHKNCIFYKTM